VTAYRRWMVLSISALFGLSTLLTALERHQARGQAPPEITLEPVVNGLASPVGITHAGDGTGRLFITLQEGRIVIYDGTSLLETAFLDIRPLVSCCGERGLLSVAFHPDYRTNGLFFVNYTNNDGDTVVARYSVSSDENVADPDSARPIITIAQPFANHNGGQLQFGPDRNLYIGMGDGGSGGDPDNRAQNPNDLLGKMLRIHVDGALPYEIPPTNPFVGTSARGEIWALGLRNPWRFSFDRLTGDLFIADVGQSGREEVDFQPAASGGGENYGWRRMEGSLCFNPGSGCLTPSLTLPVLEYDHSLGCSITGGYRYRGTLNPALYGTYFYGDFCTGRIWAATQSGGAWTTEVALDTDLRISTFGEDEAGEVYVAHLNETTGAVYRIRAPGGGGGKDLVIDGLSLSAATLGAGAATTVTYNVKNRGTVAVPETYTDRIYLSADATLGAGDPQLAASHGHTADLAAGARHSNSQPVTIGAATPPGNYFLLVKADGPGAIAEINEANNVTAVPITVTSTAGGSKDLVIEGLSLSAGTVRAGAATTVTYNVKNRGTVAVLETYIDRIYRSADATLGAGDPQLAASHGHTADLAPGARHSNTRAVTIGASTPPGNYFLLIKADGPGAIAEINEANNVTPIPITVTSSAGGSGGKDLVIEGLSLSAGTVRAGAATTVTYNVKNRGTVAVLETYIDRIYRSADATLGAGDPQLAASHGHTADLAPGARHSNTRAVTIGTSTPPGNYFLLVKADGPGAIAEINEANNVTAVPITVTSSPPAAATGEDSVRLSMTRFSLPLAVEVTR
jgi:glucose/arabinose dehydrogenase/subtilase family serine protease